MDRTGRIGAPLAPAPPLVPAPSERSVRQKGQPHDGDTLDRRPAAYRLHFQAGDKSPLVHSLGLGGEHEIRGVVGVYLRPGTLDTIGAPNAISSSVNNRSCLV